MLIPILIWEWAKDGQLLFFVPKPWHFGIAVVMAKSHNEDTEKMNKQIAPFSIGYWYKSREIKNNFKNTD